jgi:hypothetical protein
LPCHLHSDTVGRVERLPDAHDLPGVNTIRHMGLERVLRARMRIVRWVLVVVVLLSAALAGILMLYYRPTVEWLR